MAHIQLKGFQKEVKDHIIVGTVIYDHVTDTVDHTIIGGKTFNIFG